MKLLREENLTLPVILRKRSTVAESTAPVRRKTKPMDPATSRRVTVVGGRRVTPSLVTLRKRNAVAESTASVQTHRPYDGACPVRRRRTQLRFCRREIIFAEDLMVFMRLPCQHRQAVLVFFTKCGMPKIMPPTPRMQTNQIGQGWNRKRPKALYLLGFRPSMDCSEIVLGGDRRDRTADLLIANQTLSQLSYAPCSLLVTFTRFLYSPCTSRASAAA